MTDTEHDMPGKGAAAKFVETDFENTLAKHRWVSITADYGVTVWDKDGLAQPTEDLPVDPDLHQQLDAWTERCDVLDSAIQGASVDRAYGFVVELPPEDWEPLSLEGFALACAVKRQLPEWTSILLGPPLVRKEREAVPTARVQTLSRL